MRKTESKENVSKKTTKKTVTKKETVKTTKTPKVVEEKEAKKTSSVKAVSKAPEKTTDTKDKEEVMNQKIKKAKEVAASSISNIVNNIEMTYFKLKSEEAKSMDLANSTGIEMNIDKISDASINSNINSIKANSFEVKKKIELINKLDELNCNNDFLADLKSISADKSIVDEYGEEMKSIYMACFNKNARKMITDAKLKKLDKQRKEVEGEKCSFFSKLIGKAKLKQARLDNINLKEQLILTESQFSSNSYATLEDGL